MKLISAVKLKSAKQQLDQTKPFFKKISATMADILANSDDIESAYFDQRRDKPGKTTGLILLTGDKGLAGGYNHNIMKLSENMMADAENPVLFVAGQLGRSYCLRKNYNVCEEFDFPIQNPTVHRAQKIADFVIERFKKGELDEVYIAFTGMVSSVRLVTQAMRLLPVNLDVLKADIGMDDSQFSVIEGTINYEPSSAAVFDVLIPKYIKGIVYGALVEAFTSEQHARMTAMDSASTNANEMLKKLNLYYNRARQAAITQELAEIVGGATAL